MISSFHWSKPRLGPAVAKNVADLFEGELYERIRASVRSSWFSSFTFSTWRCGRVGKAWPTEKAYIRGLKAYDYFALFSLNVRVLTEVGAKWGDPVLTARLHGQWVEYYPTHFNLWRKLTKSCVDHILVAFKKDSRRYSRRGGDELTYANYFKNQGYVARMLKGKLAGDIKRFARVALES